LKTVALLCLTAVVLSLGACSTTRNRTAAWSDAQQMVVVTTSGWNATDGTLRTYARDGGGWREVGAVAAVTIGRSGSAWGLGLHPAESDGPSKREGDGRAPAGIFRIGTAFGYAESAATALPYAAMRESSYCMDVAASPLYNRIVDADRVGREAVAGSSEPMRLDLHNHGDQRYKTGFVIEHNADGVPGAGSCIFAHLWKGPGETTAGCTAMAEPVMQRLYAWLKPESHPVFVLLPEAEYARLKRAWNLPP
jgi:L,D-peptidoglycan transpeptidase YkuD (ErfK/YbiS/YcfS/YnhG family)